MTAELGLFFVVTALLTALLQTSFIVPALRPTAMLIMPQAAWLQSLFITLALAILLTLRIDSDFSVVNIAAHSNHSLPMLYKITGTWGNHEGSMLLWVWVLSGFSLALHIAHRDTSEIKGYALSIQSALCAGFLLFILFTSNPFARRFPPAVDGDTLNPLLQDVALAIHPPLLYLGYVGFSIVFSLALALLLQAPATQNKKTLTAWGSSLHPWILIAWSLLTLGIGLGSWWAYRELGWGGWWFWDPVENASLLPWLSGTALFHANTILKRRGLLARWVVLLAIVTFGLSLAGTFLVRSGALTSVHGFASDPARGLFILAYIVLAIGGALLIFSVRAPALFTSEQALPAFSRGGMIIINNVFILCACTTVFLGTVYPLLAEWLQGTKLSVGAPYFSMTFIPIMALPLFFAGLAPLLSWGRTSLRHAIHHVTPALLAVTVTMFLTLSCLKTDVALATTGFGLAAWLAVSSIQWLRGSRHIRTRVSVFLGHIGVAIMIIGITAGSLWKQEYEKSLSDGAIVSIDQYQLAYHMLPSQQNNNYNAKRSQFDVSDANGKLLTALFPEYRTYDISGISTSEADMYSTWRADLYVVLSEAPGEKTKAYVHIYVVPMIRFIWLGFVLMALGGLSALFMKRVKDTSHGKFAL